MGRDVTDTVASVHGGAITSRLEDEAITVIREVAAECARPVLLFSGGKDSVVVLHLARRAFWPARIPFPVMHVDTGHNFDEVIEFRDRTVATFGVELIVASVQASIDEGRVREAPGPLSSRNRMQTVTLLDAIAHHCFDAVFGGARRDEEWSRAKERVVSHRDEFGQWDPGRCCRGSCRRSAVTPPEPRDRDRLVDLCLHRRGQLKASCPPANRTDQSAG